MDENQNTDTAPGCDEESFRGIFEEYHTRLCYFARSILPEGEAAEDVVQEAFVKLWQKKERFSHPDSIKAFLYITVRNNCLNIYKHRKVVKMFGDLSPKKDHDEDSANGLSNLIEAEVLNNVYLALQKLPAGCRTVLNLSYFDGMKNQAIADQLGVSINTIKTQKQRGLNLLRDLIKRSSFILLFVNQFV